MAEASSLAEGPKGPLFNHCKCIAEALQGLSWVVLDAGAVWGVGGMWVFTPLLVHLMWAVVHVGGAQCTWRASHNTTTHTWRFNTPVNDGFLETTTHVYTCST